MEKIRELRPRLFSPGEVKITREVYARIKAAGLTPEQLVDRHVRDDGSFRYVKEQEQRISSQTGIKPPDIGLYQLSRTYQLGAGGASVYVSTEADFSETVIGNWPEKSAQPEFVPVAQAETEVGAERISRAERIFRWLDCKRADKQERPKRRNVIEHDF